jgi:hypothetical protein
MCELARGTEQFTDEFSGWPEVFVVPDKSAETVCRLLLQEVILRHGCPEEILTDNSGEFVNQKFARVLREYNIKHIRTSPYHPQSNGRNERQHQTLYHIVAKELRDETEWDQRLSVHAATVRMNRREGTRFTPFYLMHGREAVLPIDNLLRPRRKYVREEYHELLIEKMHEIYAKAARNAERAAHRSRKYANRNAHQQEFAVGDWVYLARMKGGSKFVEKWDSGFQVERRNAEDSYRLRNQCTGQVMDKVHVSRLRGQALPLEAGPGPSRAIIEQPEQGGTQAARSSGTVGEDAPFQNTGRGAG